MRKAIDRFIIPAIAVLHLATARVAYAAERITPEQWRRLTSDKAFSYRSLKEASQPPKDVQPGIVAKLVEGIFKFFSGGFGNLMLWLIVLGIIGFILYKLFVSKDSFLFGRQNKQMRDEDGDINEGDITTTEWEPLMQQAIKAGDMRLAVRYSYMLLLRLMQQSNLISYRLDKTNFDYYSELSDTEYKQPFRQLSRQYEYVWYGQYPISEAAFNGYLEQFTNLKNQLRQ